MRAVARDSGRLHASLRDGRTMSVRHHAEPHVGSARERMNHAERSKTLRPLPPSARGSSDVQPRPAMGTEVFPVTHKTYRKVTTITQ